MSWDVHLWCNQCGEGNEPGGKMIGVIRDVDSGTLAKPEPRIPFSEIRVQMRKHEVEVHGGKP